MITHLLHLIIFIVINC